MECRCFLALAVALWGSVFSLPAMGDGQVGPVQPPDTGALAPAPDMVRDARCRQFIAPCLVNGRPARLMLDTGATHTVLAADFVARELLQLEKLEGIRLSGNAHEAPVPARALVQVGEFELGRSLVLVMNLSGVNSLMAQPIDGILGMAELGQLPFSLDLRGEGGGYWAEPAEEAGMARPLSGRKDAAGRLFLPARSGEHSCFLLLDTGSSATTWPTGQWPVGERGGSALRVADVNGARDSGVARGAPAPLELPGGLVLPQVEPLLQGGGGGCVLGLDALGGCLLIHRPGQGFFLVLPEKR